VWISQRPDEQRGDYSDVYNYLSEDALQMWLMLNENPTWVTFTDEQWDLHTKQFTKLTRQLVHEGMGDRAAIVNRHGLGQMRIAAVLTMIRKWELYRKAKFGAEGDSKEGFREETRMMMCRQDDYQTATLMTEALLSHSLHMSTTMTTIQQKHVQSMSRWNWVDDALMQLNKRFTIREWIDIALQNGRSKSQGYRSINQLVKDGIMRQECENGVRTYYKSAR